MYEHNRDTISKELYTITCQVGLVLAYLRKKLNLTRDIWFDPIGSMREAVNG